MTWAELIELVKTKPRDEAFAAIDAWVAQHPDFTEAGNRVKAFLDQLYAAAAVGDKVTAAMGEILSLIQTGEGPVSSAPEIGLV